MTTRPATSADHHDHIAWLRPDDPEHGVRVVVEERDGVLVGAALRCPNDLHPGLDFLDLEVPGAASTELLDAVVALAPEAMLMRGIPGTPAHSLAMAAGASVFERVPASRINPTDADVRAWVAAHRGLARPGADYSTEMLTELWIRYYLASHAHFGVTTDPEVLRESLGGFVSHALDHELTRLVEVDGTPVSVGFVFREGPGLMALVDSLDADNPQAREHVATAMAAVLDAVSPEPIEFDGHESGEHYPAVLATVPHVTSGPLTPMELLRLGGATPHATAR